MPIEPYKDNLFRAFFLFLCQHSGKVCPPFRKIPRCTQRRCVCACVCVFHDYAGLREKKPRVNTRIEYKSASDKSLKCFERLGFESSLNVIRKLASPTHPQI